MNWFQSVKAGDDSKIGKLMRKDAFVEEKGHYSGSAAGSKNPPILTTPPPSTSLTKLLESDATPSPIGVQTDPWINVELWYCCPVVVALGAW